MGAGLAPMICEDGKVKAADQIAKQKVSASAP
jgi:hypothetical protein